MRSSLISSRFRGVYVGLVLLWILAALTLNLIIESWLMPLLFQQRLASVEALIHSHHQALLYNDNRALRDELLANRIILDDRNFDELWIEQTNTKLQSLSKSCNFKSDSICLLPSGALFFNAPYRRNPSETSFGIYLATDYFSQIAGIALWRIAGATLLAMLIGLVAWAIRRQENFLIKKIGLLVDSQRKIAAIFGDEQTRDTKIEHDEFEVISNNLEQAAIVIQDRTRQIEHYKDEFQRKVEELTFAQFEAKKNQALTQMASQVAHDIRSPLASLNAAIHFSYSMDEKSKAQIRTATNQIRDIANSLLAKNRDSKKDSFEQSTLNRSVSANSRSVELISAIVESAVSQKRTELGSRTDTKITYEVATDAVDEFAEIQSTELRRILSNILNNSIEAFEKDGQITVILSRNRSHATIQITDNGKGIPKELLSKVIECGGTFGKKNGNGLGLSHAKSTIESWGGTFALESEPGRGTTATLALPVVEHPDWFRSSIEVQPNTTIVIIDDDPAIHNYWESTLNKKVPELQQVHLSTPDDFLGWYRDNLSMDNVFYICDYEFADSNQTGIDLIDMTGISNQSVLTTNHWDDSNVLSRCEKLGLKVLPKALLAMTDLKIAVV